MGRHSTDDDWEHFGSTDPYWGVITQERFRREKLDDGARREFFASGEQYVQRLLGLVRRHIAADFTPHRSLDFGCGVGRLTAPLAAVSDSVVGVDVSDSMLAEAQRNLEVHHVTNVRLLKSDDRLSQVSGEFDLINTYIVLQHIPSKRGQAIIRRLVELLAPGGVGAVHVTYSQSLFDENPAAHWPASSFFYSSTLTEEARQFWPIIRRIASRRLAGLRRRNLRPHEPRVEMHAYTLNPLFHWLQVSGVRRMHVEFSDHSGHYGTLLLFQKTTDGGYEF